MASTNNDKKSFDSCDSIMSYWETFKLETLNQKISRMVLGVPKISSRLATLGELGRFPLFVKGLCRKKSKLVLA